MTKKEIDLKEMLEAGVHFGHKKDRWNPKMRPFIYTERNGVHIFDLVITKKKLEEAMDFVSKITSEGGSVLFVGTKNQVKDIVKNAAESAEMPYLTDRWPGGMFTNFQTIVKRLK
ncbi:MAG: 30S ribosomal protein S2, partial [Candidatus Moranbacteria bacterium]|nr:30S ribosomal protein S2 [Candidatus Moranbacteria bacterium]